MKKNPLILQLKLVFELLRWHKPSGRLILLIPAGWSLWLSPSPLPSIELIGLIIFGGLFTSGAGCIANDLWDKGFDGQVERTKMRPLARGTLPISTAIFVLSIMLLLSLLIVFALPIQSQSLCLGLASLALIPILLYPSAKRWFGYPQAVLAFCWGFAVLIPWAAKESNLSGGWPLIATWLATLFWTFGFDTVYAMADKSEDRKLGLKSSVLSLREKSLFVVKFSYALTCFLLAIGAVSARLSWIFWPFWLVACIGMQNETSKLKGNHQSIQIYGIHFQKQVLLGGLLLIGIIFGRIF